MKHPCIHFHAGRWLQFRCAKRPTIKKVVNDAREFYKSRNINHLISLAIRIKESYIEHSFYNRVLVISYFMKVDKTENALIDVLDDKIIKPIEALYFTNSKHKKMLLDLGIYERYKRYIKDYR